MKFIVLTAFVSLVACRPYTGQEADPELTDSELEKQQAAYIVSREKFKIEPLSSRKTEQENSFFDDEFFDKLEVDEFDFDSGHEVELQRATTYASPSVPLKFRDSGKKKPKKKNLNKKRLLRKIGADFDPKWMSVDMPLKLDIPEVLVGEDQMAELSKQVTDLDLQEELSEISASVDADNPAVSKLVDVFKQWLVKKSTCPVTYTWIDIGEYFWPRYIKQGNCGNLPDSTASREYEDDYIDGKSSKSLGCSWPSGMKCIQGDTKTLHLLRWHCRKRRKSSDSGDGQTSKDKRRKCKWYKVPYPVTSSCKCACK